MKDKVIFPAFLLIILASCTHLSPPDGFAAYEYGNRFEAVSPEGMRYRVRIVANEPIQTPEFWSEALGTHLRKEGYIPLGEAVEFTAAGNKGFVHEWVLPYGHESFFYMTAVVVTDSVLAVVESAAEHTIYERYRSALLASIKNLDLSDVKPDRPEAPERVKLFPLDRRTAK
ncbi:MAG: hypothetical protein HN368_10880, partial [Spirochaetales bacterium]|nr:hypothetical protein [Spirochaetales bacterium]